MKSGCIRLGTIAGIPLELHFSWAIVFALLAWSLATGYFPKAVPDLPAGSYWSKGILAGALAGRPGAAAVAGYLAMLNGVVVLFNLIPAFPLDGGRILRAALWRAWGDLPRATRAAAGAGRFFAYFLMVGGIFGLLSGQTGAALWQLLIGLFLLQAAQASSTQVWLKAVPPEERDQVSVQAVALPVEAPVRTAPGADAVDALQQMLQAGHGRLLVFEGEIFRGLLTHTGVTRLLQIKMALSM